MASRRKRGPVALRPQLSLGLPLSVVTMFYERAEKWRQFWLVRSDGGFCGEAVIQTKGKPYSDRRITASPAHRKIPPKRGLISELLLVYSVTFRRKYRV
jgi:hypothetical protein